MTDDTKNVTLATVKSAVGEASSSCRIDIAIMDGREVPGFWLDGHVKRYRALRSWHLGELICLGDHWLDANGFSGIIDKVTRYARVLNGPMDFVESIDPNEMRLVNLLDRIEVRARSCGLDRRWIPTHEGPVYSGKGYPVLAPANSDEGELAVAAQPLVLVALVAKVRELLAFVDKVDYASPDLRSMRDVPHGYDNARMELDHDLGRLRRIEIS
jgi:hypothetical protein